MTGIDNPHWHNDNTSHVYPVIQEDWDDSWLAASVYMFVNTTIHVRFWEENLMQDGNTFYELKLVQGLRWDDINTKSCHFRT